MQKNEHWNMLYSDISLDLDNKNKMEISKLSHYLHLPEKSCEKNFYLYLVKMNDDNPDFSTLEPVSSVNIGIDFRYMEDDWIKKNKIEIKHNDSNSYTLKLTIRSEKDYGSGIKTLSLCPIVGMIESVEFLKIYIGATHHWNVVYSEKFINPNIGRYISGNNLKRTESITEEKSNKEGYLYLIKGDEFLLDCSTMKSLEANAFKIDYYMRNGAHVERTSATGMSVKRIELNKYRFVIDNSRQQGYHKGTGVYAISPITTAIDEESEIIHDFKIDTFEHWSVICCEHALDLNNKEMLKYKHITGYIAVPVNDEGISENDYYLYVAKNRKNSYDYDTLIPVMTENFECRYMIDDYQMECSEGKGVTVTKVKDNFYHFNFNVTEQEDYNIGSQEFLIKPVMKISNNPIMLHGLGIFTWWDI